MTDDFTITPFDPDSGIWFKYGRVYQDRDNQIAEFERETKFKLPPDFLNLIGEYCEGGFDGWYRGHFKDNVEVLWRHLLLMKHPDDVDPEEHDTIRLLCEKPMLFYCNEILSLFPFGEAYAHFTRDQSSDGYLAFDVSRANAVVYVSEEHDQKIDIAKSFRDMMLDSQFVFYG